MKHGERDQFGNIFQSEGNPYCTDCCYIDDDFKCNSVLCKGGIYVEPEEYFLGELGVCSGPTSKEYPCVFLEKRGNYYMCAYRDDLGEWYVGPFLFFKKN